jgi:hypothetical protein
VVFGGNEARERGALISRRVAALAVGPDGLRSDDTFSVTEGDLVQFCAAWARGEVTILNMDADLRRLMSDAVATGTVDRGTLPLLQMYLDDDGNADALFEWKARQINESATSASPEDVRNKNRERRCELRARLEECYKLRNDIVHAGYDYEPVAEEMYNEISRLFGSFVINLAFNCTTKRTYAAFLYALDDEWRGPERRLREKAYFYWLERGRPIGDAWADWFRAEREPYYT